MPRIPWSQLFPAMDAHPPRWVRAEDGQYRPDFSRYPADAPRARVVMRDPLTGVVMLELPTVETDAADVEEQEDGADVAALDDDQSPDAAARSATGAEAEADPGAAPDAA